MIERVAAGTKKIAAIASYVIAALEQGRILIVDELDSSIHFKLTRAIVAMFNNELNTNASIRMKKEYMFIHWQILPQNRA